MLTISVWIATKKYSKILAHKSITNFAIIHHSYQKNNEFVGKIVLILYLHCHSYRSDGSHRYISIVQN